MMRTRYDLDGLWDFIYDEYSQLGSEDLHHKNWRHIMVPAPWQAQIEGLEESTGTGWYRKTFTVDTSTDNPTFILHIGAAYHYAQVWLNGHYLGDHDGGWLPFEFTLDKCIKPDIENELIVRVVVPDHDSRRYPDFPASEILHGKQTWYGSWGGLWQSVYIEQRARVHIQDFQLSMDADHAVITPTIILNQWRSNLTWQVDVLDGNNTRLHSEDFGEISDRIECEDVMLRDEPALWSPDDPALYTIRVRLFENQQVIDEVIRKSGFRKIEARDGQLFLNDTPFYMIGALDQDYYPDTLATPPSEAFLQDQFQKAKAMGLNTIRYHIKVADPRYYDLADEMGLLLWVDLPNWTILSDATKDRIKTTLAGMVQRDGHHPSIAIWTIVNEDWGTDLVHSAEHRQWLKETYHWLKKLDPTRLVVDNSPCEPNFHVESDIADYHYYRGIPDHADSWDELTHIVATDRSYSYSPHGDAIYAGDEPIIVSEFGNWGLPDIDNLLDETGKEPWWFETGHDWGEGIVHPHGIKRRFKQWHLDRVFGSFEALTEAMQWQQYRALKHEIESIRSHSAIQGYVITELTDIHWENNGLMDMSRQPRLFAPHMARLNEPYLVMARFNRSAYKSGEDIHIQLTLSNLGQDDRTITEIGWQLEDKNGLVQIADVIEGVNPAGKVSIRQTVAQAHRSQLQLYLHFATGERLLSNEYSIPIYPESQTPDLNLYVADDELRSVFAELDYALVSHQGDADVLVVTRMTDDLRDFIASGGRVLLVANDQKALPQYESGYVIYQDAPFARLMDRQSTIWNGDWVSSFSWLSPAFQSGSTPLLDNQFADITPDYVLTGFTQSDSVQDIAAGLFVGWIHRPVTLLGYRQYHRGCIALTTFKLQSLDTSNPAQVLLLSDILNQMNLMPEGRNVQFTD